MKTTTATLGQTSRLFFLGAVVSFGCAGAEGQARSPAEQAASMERTRCGADLDAKALEPVLDGKAIDSVLPLYANIESGKAGAQSELQGAIIRVRALQGVTAEWLDRALECHSAQRVLGRVPDSAFPSDPFWLPGRVVDIDTQSARDGFAVAVRGSTSGDAREILERANRALASAQASSGAAIASEKAR
jgi:hypothetical protein